MKTLNDYIKNLKEFKNLSDNQQENLIQEVLALKNPLLLAYILNPAFPGIKLLGSRSVTAVVEKLALLLVIQNYYQKPKLENTLAGLLERVPGFEDTVLHYPSLSKLLNNSLRERIENHSALFNQLAVEPHKVTVENVLAIVKSVAELANAISQYPAAADALLKFPELRALIQDSNGLSLIIFNYQNDVVKLLKNYPEWLIFIDDGFQLIGFISGRPELAEFLLENIQTRNLITSDYVLAEIIIACPKLAEKLLEDIRLLNLINNPYELAKIIKVYPQGAQKLLANPQLRATIFDGIELGEIVSAYPEVAAELLNDISLRQLINNASSLSNLAKINSNIAIALINDPKMRALIQNHEELSYVIEAYPEGALQLLEDNRLKNLINNASDLATVLRRNNRNVNLLIAYPELKNLIKDGSGLSWVIDACPDAALKLLDDPKMVVLIDDIDSLVTIVRAYPAGAVKLLEEDRLCNLIPSSYQLARLIVPDSIKLLRNSRLKKLLTTIDKYLEIVRACPASAAELLTDTNISSLIQDGDQLVQVIQYYPARANELLKDLRLRALITNGMQIGRIIIANSVEGSALLADPQLLKLIQGSEQISFILRNYPQAAEALLKLSKTQKYLYADNLFGLINTNNQTLIFEILKHDGLKEKIENDAEMFLPLLISILKVEPAAVVFFMDIAWKLIRPEDIAVFLTSLIQYDSNQSVLSAYQQIIAPFADLQPVEKTIKEITNILQALSTDRSSIGFFAFASCACDYIFEYAALLELETIEYLLLDAIPAFIKAFEHVESQKQTKIADYLVSIAALYGENKRIATILNYLEPSLQGIRAKQTFELNFNFFDSKRVLPQSIIDALKEWQQEHTQTIPPWKARALIRTVAEEFGESISLADLKAVGFTVKTSLVKPSFSLSIQQTKVVKNNNELKQEDEPSNSQQTSFLKPNSK